MFLGNPIKRTIMQIEKFAWWEYKIHLALQYKCVIPVVHFYYIYQHNYNPWNFSYRVCFKPN